MRCDPYLPKKDSILLHETTFRGKEAVYLKTCIDTGWASPPGFSVDQFEYKVAQYTGVKSAAPVANGKQQDSQSCPRMDDLSCAEGIEKCLVNVSGSANLSRIHV